MAQKSSFSTSQMQNRVGNNQLLLTIIFKMRFKLMSKIITLPRYSFFFRMSFLISWPRELMHFCALKSPVCPCEQKQYLALSGSRCVERNVNWNFRFALLFSLLWEKIVEIDFLQMSLRNTRPTKGWSYFPALFLSTICYRPKYMETISFRI